MLVFKVPTFLYVAYVTLLAWGIAKSLSFEPFSDGITVFYWFEYKNRKFFNFSKFGNQKSSKKFDLKKKKEMKRLPFIIIREVIAFHWYICKNRNFLNFSYKKFSKKFNLKKNSIILVTIYEIIAQCIGLIIYKNRNF